MRKIGLVWGRMCSHQFGLMAIYALYQTTRRLGCVGSNDRFIVLAVATLVVLLSGAVACDVGGDGTGELIYEPIGTPVVEVLLEAPAASDGGSAESSSLASCGGDLVKSWGDRSGAVAWSRGLSGHEIVFSMGLEVYAVGADGRGLRMLSEAEGEGGSAGTTALDVSPDGLQVVYTPCESLEGFSGYEHELAVARVDGGPVRQLTENTHFEKYPSWSPDGERIAFVSSGATPGVIYEWNDVHLYSMAADGTDVRRIAEGPLVHETPRWSPDGERIAYAIFEDRGLGQPPAIYIHVVGAGGGDSQRLTDAASGPSWSPDGERIAYARVDGDEVALYTIAADGTDARRLAEIDGWQPGPRHGEPDPSKAWIQKVSWSPEGSQILYLINNVDQGRLYSEVHVVEAGGGLAKLTVDNPFPDSIEDAAWSPDGTRIALSGQFHGSAGSRSSAPTAQIVVLSVAADGTDLRVLVGRQVAGSVLNRPLQGSLVGLVAERGDISAHVAACGDGVAVPEPETNPGLVEDCKALLEVQNALAGPDGLNWFVEWNMSEWEGVVVDGSPPRVRGVVLNSRNLGGEIPPELSRLTELRVLAMGTNALMGEIPAELGELTNLEVLSLAGNYLSGEIPAELGRLSGLTHLSLTANNLEGEIPAELSEFGELIHLSLSGNNLEGQIPSELGELKALTHLSLAGNNLTGEIPVELGQLTNLIRLRLSGNRFIGCLPAGLRDISNTDVGDLGLPDCE